ncbi:5'-nucleotidase C-terminal domain-containing protein [Schaalia sp. 19OD2882]|uniref:bifunctional metallophosphatase/5'-nucleotidase n=1 Tax=Schaalia sp. 19OD2882 TaxID=2794089 RepID=UPI001C1E96DF|nr:5'-nucleotidase C-terminal domain-containing protein [Schaalia sp. 19OD2882]QWW19889.1 5'-nucleotidase C-terminal domain-containing protein [Schaalia sp. 19OD2882]
MRSLRRQSRFALALVAALGLALAPLGGVLAADTPSSGASDAPASDGVDTARPAPAASPTLTVLATTDVHGHIHDWDYFKGGRPDKGKDFGLSRLGDAIETIRAERGADSVLTVDNGDAIQGTPLTYLAAKQPNLLTGGPIHPMARAFNLLKYDVTVVGNHEFNYGLDLLRSYDGQLDAPLLGANVVKAGTTEPWLPPYTMVDKVVDGHRVKVGVLGLVTPGVRIWDKANVQGVLEFRDTTTVAKEYVPRLKAEGADVVVVLAHTGVGNATSWVPEDLEENSAQFLSTMVNDIDVLVIGHTHQDVPVTVSTAPDGDPVVVTQPKNWAASLSEVRLPLAFDADGKASVAWPAADASATIPSWVTRHSAADMHDNGTIDTDPILTADHEATIRYVNQVVADAVVAMPAGTARYEDTPILDFIGKVMVDTVTEGVKGTSAASLPVIAQVSPFSKDAVFPKGPVTIKDIAGLYIYDNTLLGVEVTGAQIKDYLEYSAKYFKQLPQGATLDPDTDLNAEYNGRPTPDYNYDVLTGVTYTIDVSRPAGQRILNLAWQGKPLASDQKFVLAINNYRQAGGGGYPHVTTAPVVYDELVEIRQQLIDHAQKVRTIDPADFFVKNWTLTTRYVPPTTPTPAPNPDPSKPNPSQPIAVPTPAATPKTPAPKGSDLASTGADMTLGGLMAVLAVTAGTGLMMVARRRVGEKH